MTPPQTTYIICALPRSGSHLLGEALYATRLAGKPDEYFQPNAQGQLQNETGLIAELYGEKSLEEFHQFVMEIATTPNGVCGVTLHSNYLHHIINNYRTLPQYADLNTYEIINALFYNPKFIWLQRRNKVRQAVSWIKAMHTGVWGVSKDKVPQKKRTQMPKYDYFVLEHQIERFRRFEAQWGAFFEEYEIEPLVVVYEDLAQKVEETTLKVLDFLEIPYPSDIEFAERKLQKQANATTEKWVQTYYQQKRSPFHKLFRAARWVRFKLLPG